jgi:predicted O-methyltransferase YrrM
MVGVARKCRGPIIETGSGLSSVLMAASNPDATVYSLEHLEGYAAQTVSMAESAGVSNVGVCYAPLLDGWYDLEKFDLPNKFTLGVCDGPPRLFGTRMRFFEELGPRCKVIVADDVGDDIRYGEKIHKWAEANNRTVQLLGRAALICEAS